MTITKQKLNNKQFRKTETEILRVFFERGGFVTMKEIAKTVGMARSTIYYHHRSAKEIVSDYENYILCEYSKLLKKTEGVKLQKVFYRTLIFIMINKNVFLVFLRVHDRRVFAEMVDRIRPIIAEYVKMNGDTEMVYEIYVNELIIVVKKWGEGGFSEDSVTDVLGDIMYLTNTLKIRLGPLVKY